MVSARLPADIGTKLRDHARAVDPFLKDAKNNTRPVAGINLLRSGDLWQLTPPDGGFLGDKPVDNIFQHRQSCTDRVYYGAKPQLE